MEFFCYPYYVYRALPYCIWLSSKVFSKKKLLSWQKTVHFLYSHSMRILDYTTSVCRGKGNTEKLIWGNYLTMEEEEKCPFQMWLIRLSWINFPFLFLHQSCLTFAKGKVASFLIHHSMIKLRNSNPRPMLSKQILKMCFFVQHIALSLWRNLVFDKLVNMGGFSNIKISYLYWLPDTLCFSLLWLPHVFF